MSNQSRWALAQLPWVSLWHHHQNNFARQSPEFFKRNRWDKFCTILFNCIEFSQTLPKNLNIGFREIDCFALNFANIQDNVFCLCWFAFFVIFCWYASHLYWFTLDLIEFDWYWFAGAGYWFFGGSEDAQKRRAQFADTVDYCSYMECCSNKHIVYDIDGLKADLQARLFGQHIVNATLIPALRAHVRNLDTSEKALVMSFHGSMGTGKNYVSDLIIKHFYKQGENSKFVHRYRSRKDFPVDDEAEVAIYRVSTDYVNRFVH